MYEAISLDFGAFLYPTRALSPQPSGCCRMPDLQGVKKAKAKGKKKNPGPADFKKQKVKVGRKLVKKNETSTSIKSRKLNLQKQSVDGEWCLALRATPWGSTLTRLRSS